MSDELQAAYAELLEELHQAEGRLRAAEPALDESERVEGYRWIFSLLSVAMDAYVWADSGRPRFTDIVGPYRKWGGDNSDAYYQYIAVDPRRTYRVSCRPGDAAYLSLTIYGGPDDGRYSNRIVGMANTRSMKPSADGSFELWLSPEPQPGNWLKLEADAVCGLTRDYLNDPVKGVRAQWSIEAVDPPKARVDDAATLARRFRAVRTWLGEQSRMCPLRISPANYVQEPYPVPKQTYGWSAGDASYAMGSFELAEGQSLLIEGRSPPCAFWNVCLWNPFIHTYDYAYDQVTINASAVTLEADGSWKLVVSATDPGVPNWLCTQGHARGLIWFRWFLPDQPVERPKATLLGRDGKPVPQGQAAKPDTVVLDDLAEPKFPPAVRPLLDMLAGQAKNIRLVPAELCEQASRQTGLKDWGEQGFRERLEVLCWSLREEADLNALGHVTMGGQIGQALRNRLLLEDLIRRNPEIEQVQIERPIIICGMPRTGTTHLFNLMSADPQLRHLPYWESLEPVLPEAERPAPGQPDPRLGRCAQAVAFLDGLAPHFKRMHEMTPEHAREEIQLMVMDIAGTQFETMAHIPAWRDHYRRHDQTPSYLYLKRILKALTWLRGGQRWVLKCPQHLEQFGPLLAAFPDATLVLTHRNPVEVAASMTTMVAYGRRMSTDRPDLRVLGRYWTDRTIDFLDGCMEYHDRLPPDRTVDIRIQDFVADEMAAIKKIYRAAGQPLDGGSIVKMTAYSESHPNGRHGTVAYDLAPFGVDVAQLAERTRGYAAKFGVEAGIRKNAR
jgi:hypothetical protein